MWVNVVLWGGGGGWKQTADIYKSYENNFFTHKILRNSNLLSAPEETLIKFPREMWDKFYISYKNIAFTCEYKVFKRHYFYLPCFKTESCMQTPGKYYFQNDTELEKIIILYLEIFLFLKWTTNFVLIVIKSCQHNEQT